MVYGKLFVILLIDMDGVFGVRVWNRIRSGLSVREGKTGNCANVWA